ncbi:hypothetical protein [Kordia sp.]|uniref:hypothetical protein n=1 Tax=Kordia sp. TaxID=1965332 RepID=UPI003D2C1241
MKIKNYILALIIVSITVGCKSPKVVSEDKFSIVYTSAHGKKLNGPVKEVRSFFTRNYMSADISKEMMTTNFLKDSARQYDGNSLEDIKFEGFYVFDENGMQTSYYPLKKSITQVVADSIPSKKIFIYDKEQFNKLKTYKISKLIPFPVYNPYTISASIGSFRTLVIMNDSSKLQLERIYKYDFDEEGRVVNKKEYMHIEGYQINEIIDIESRIANNYNSIDQIISQQYFFIENDVEFHTRSGYVDYTINLTREHDALFDYYEYDIDFEYYGIKDSLNYKNFLNEFTYDDRGNMKNFTFYVKNEPFKKETYTYNDKDILVSLERYVQADKTVGSFDNYYKREFFDNYGNIIKSVTSREESFSKPKIRLYQYKYDQYNNWTECNMYLDGEIKEVPTIIAKRIITYYED